MEKSKGHISNSVQILLLWSIECVAWAKNNLNPMKLTLPYNILISNSPKRFWILLKAQAGNFPFLWKFMSQILMPESQNQTITLKSFGSTSAG